MTAEIAKVINDGLCYYEEELWFDQEVREQREGKGWRGERRMERWCLERDGERYVDVGRDREMEGRNGKRDRGRTRYRKRGSGDAEQRAVMRRDGEKRNRTGPTSGSRGKKM